MTREPLTARTLNRALLARQLLVERSSIGIPEALQQVAGLQMQYAPSGYIGLWTRLRHFERDQLTRALETRDVVQATLMRSTIHLVAAADYWPMVTAMRRGRRAWWRRVSGAPGRDTDMDSVAEAVRGELADGSLREAELKDRLRERAVGSAVNSGIQLWVDLVRVPPSGTWERRRADLYGLADRWLEPSTATEQSGQDLLIRRYLGAFGPASASNIAGWAGLRVTELRDALERAELVREVAEDGSELFDLPNAPRPDEGTEVPVRFLPTWDATLLVHARRTQILPEAFRPLVFNTKTPHSFPSFLIDGQVAGTWRHRAQGIEITPFRPLTPAERRALDDEAEQLSAFMAD